MSVSTVSLVLNDRDEGRVKPAIAEQVRATAKRLGYRPNPLARSLRTSKTRILGFISEGIAATPYAGGIILGAQDAASADDLLALPPGQPGAAPAWELNRNLHIIGGALEAGELDAKRAIAQAAELAARL